ncbi:MAG: beta-propeller fold lactonase family protein, partial [Bacteroidetes bacterium]|nr:beta-propeller fold lactonase family protein [Bacteroidota bacterium]
NWSYVKGSATPNSVGSFGTLGVETSTNIPSSRFGSVSWVDSQGKLWMFGGYGNAQNNYGQLNDLWKFDPVTNNWTWINGSNSANQLGSYGTLRNHSISNIPESRSYSVSWKDNSGNLYLFGGRGGATGYLNDLWLYNISSNEWTWMGGSNTSNASGVYGTLGNPSVSNIPGARFQSVSWVDGSGKIWIFGGYGYDATNNYAYLNDLWCYNPNTYEWTWVNGDNYTNANGSYVNYRSLSASNKPGARQGSTAWYDPAGKLWLLGGQGFGASASGYLNDLWYYNTSTNQWNWYHGDNNPNQNGIYGQMGISNPQNKPGSRQSSAYWIDNNNDFWLFGGTGYTTGGAGGQLNDLWKFNLGTGNWTWKKGANIPNHYSTITSGSPSLSNLPGSRKQSISWTDNNGDLWIFGGYGNSSSGGGMLNDLWKYNKVDNTWAWIKGSNTNNQSGVYGTLGVGSQTNTPSARYQSVSWTDAIGNLWLFGGYGNAASNGGYLNDLWKYNPNSNEWTWMGGDNSASNTGSYGSRGVPSPTNKPGSRFTSVSWTDTIGNLWLFGGYGFGAVSSGLLNDLWKYDPIINTWTWMNGYSNIGQPSNFGVKGVPNISNVIGARQNAGGWVDNNGDLWVFGGYGYDNTSNIGALNDLWKYKISTNTWTWMNGDNSINQSSVYGSLNVSSPSNKPGSRYNFISKEDNSNNFLLFGGQGLSGYLNDLWKYNVTLNQWTWIKGDPSFNQTGNYGAIGVPAPSNKPGSRMSSVAWKDESGSLWVFGGYGYNQSSQGYLNDLWKLEDNPKIVINSQSGDRQICVNDFTLGSISFNITAPTTGDYRIYVYEFGVMGASGANLCYIGNTTNISGGSSGVVSINYDRWYFTNMGNLSYQNKHYYVYVVNAADPINSNAQGYDLIIQPKPSVVITNPSAVCSPNTIDLTALAVTAGSTGSLTYTYWTDNAATSSYATPASASNGTYYIKGTDANSCSVISSVVANVYQLPTLNITNPTPVCSSGSVDITASSITVGSSSSLTYTYWTDNAATISYSTPTSATSGRYYIKGTNANSCSAIASVVVSVNPMPTVNPISDISVCANNSLNAINFTGVVTNAIYNWNNNNTSIGLASNGIGNIPSFLAINNSNSPVTAQISATPKTTNEGFAYIPNVNSNTVSVIDISSNILVATIPVGTYPFAVSVDNINNKIYIANSGSNNISVINSNTNTVIETVHSNGLLPMGLVISPDGNTIYVANENSNSIAVIDATSYTLITSISVGNGPRHILFNSTGSKLYVGNQADNNISVINTSTNSVVATIPTGANPLSSSLSPDGNRLYVTNYLDGTVSVINTNNNTILSTITVGSLPMGLVHSPDGSRVYVTNHNSNTVSVINTETNSVITNISVGVRPAGISISENGLKLFVGNANSNSVSVINTSTNTVISSVGVGVHPYTLG